MQFPFVIRKLRKILRNEENLAMHHDRFAPKRIPEIKRAIEVLNTAPPPVAAPGGVVKAPIVKRNKLSLSEIINQIPLFK